MNEANFSARMSIGNQTEIVKHIEINTTVDQLYYTEIPKRVYTYVFCVVKAQLTQGSSYRDINVSKEHPFVRSNFM